jgi:hypothetical protein
MRLARLRQQVSRFGVTVTRLGSRRTTALASLLVLVATLVGVGWTMNSSGVEPTGSDAMA